MNTTQQQFFTLQLSTLLEAGVPLLQCLEMIRSGFPTKKSHWLDSILQELNEGIPFSTSLRNSPEGFDAFYCGLIEVGEHSGTLCFVLEKISNELSSQETTKAKVKKAFTYPTCILFLSLFMVSAMLIWIVPTFETVFNGFNAQLPKPTQMILNLSRMARYYSLHFLLLVFLIFISFLSFWSFSINFQKWVDRIFLSIPFFGKLTRFATIARWSTTVASLQEAGLPLIDSIRISARCTDDWIIHDFSAQIYNYLIKGFSVHDALKLSDPSKIFFSTNTLQLIKVGEDSGELVRMLYFLASHHVKKLDASLSVLLEMLEPLLVGFIGLIVGGMVISLYLPLFKLGEIA